MQKISMENNELNFKDQQSIIQETPTMIFLFTLISLYAVIILYSASKLRKVRRHKEPQNYFFKAFFRFITALLITRFIIYMLFFYIGVRSEA